MSRYLDNLDSIGADAEASHAVLVRVRNAADLARSQGILASVAQAILPATVETRVYSEIAKQLGVSLKEKGIDAEVQVVDPAAWKPANSSHLWTDLAFAVGGAGVLAFVWRVFFWRKR